MASVIIPTYNAAIHLPALLRRLHEQTLTHELIIIDSDSRDASRKILKQENIPFVSITRSEFNHGNTRNLGISLAQHENLIFLTQDALPTDAFSLERLVQSMTKRDDISMAYGRQLPYPHTGIPGRFARLNNYPAYSMTKSFADIPRMGIKTCSCSNSFAAYRKSRLLAVGGFPSDTILGEDVSVGAKFILNGQSIAYNAEAKVFHSHDYSLKEEFKRYFDIGVFHQQQWTIIKKFTEAESEGFNYMKQEWSYLWQNGHAELILPQLVRSIAKYVGYRAGRWQQFLPLAIKARLSMHRSFWTNQMT